MNKKKSSPHLPLTHALGWIVASMLFINGIAYVCLKMYLRSCQGPKIVSEEQLIRSIVQTGPQKEALKTEYLAEILGMSIDRPPHVNALNFEQSRQQLLSSPLISQAHVKIIKPNILYIDYTVRQPFAFLADFENVVIDKEGYPFPFSPFFSPKNLPYIYLGLSPYGAPSEDLEKPIMQWNRSLKGEYLNLALEILSFVTDPKVEDNFNVESIDVSNAFSNSCGTREIILITQDVIFFGNERKEDKQVFSRILRLSPKNFAQELGNYLKLRIALIEEDRKRASIAKAVQKRSEKIIDLRIPNLAFIEEK